MPKSSSEQSRKLSLDELFVRADKLWRAGRLRDAFRLFLTAANAGDRASQLNVGYFYDIGLGTTRSKEKALQWYKRAYRRGDANAATSIGTVWRDKGELQRALSWFKRAAKMGDDSSNLEIAIHYLRNEHDPQTAIKYLDQVCASDRVSESELTKAKKLRTRAQKQVTSARLAI